MIRKLNKEDNDNLMRLVMEEPEFNLYIIGDVENFGYSQDFLELFGEFNECGVLSAVLVRYFSYFNLYAKERFDLDGFVNIMKSYDRIAMLSGKTQIVSKFEGQSLGLNSSRLYHFAVLREIKPAFETDEKIIEETKEIIRRYEENIKRVEVRLEENRKRLKICEGALHLKVIEEIISKDEA
jgi:predicted GNAT family acetyltransferase